MYPLDSATAIAASVFSIDSFKRACVNWGIGRELYTAPFIWIPKELCSIKTDQNGKHRCYDRFYVTNIHYDDDGAIDALCVKNEGGVKVFYMDHRREEAKDGD